MNGDHSKAPGAGSPVLATCSSQRMCSWTLTCCLAFQHLAVQASLLCVFHLLLLPTLPKELPRAQATSELLARSLFACGISTMLQTTLGSRLPLVQIPSFEYLVPAMVLSSHLSPGASTDRNGTAMARTCPALHCTVAGSQAALLQEVSGAVLVSGLIQLVLGVFGMCGWAAQHCGPMVLAPSLSIIGLSTYKEAAFFCSTNWGVALLYVSLGTTLAHAPCCHLLPALAVLPSAILCLALCSRGLHRAISSHPAHVLGAAPVCWCLHCLCHPQLLPYLLGITGPGHGTAILGQRHLSCPLGPHPLCRRVGVAAAHPPGAGSGHCHGHQLQHELIGLLCAVWEAAASPSADPSRLQPGALHGRVGQPPRRTAGHSRGHGLQHCQHLHHWPHSGWLSPLSASKCAGMCGAGHVPEASRASQPHPAGSSWRGALCHLRRGCGHGHLLLPVCRHRLREEYLHCRLCHVYGTAGSTVVRRSSDSSGHRLGATGPPLPLSAQGACLLNWLLVIFSGEHSLRNSGGTRAALQAGTMESWGR
ncbi:solute carrier family 23 member 3 isoform X2 [Pithys albifrons albifrons]|uniref:solute carrier family 23 member 3 isoform X2 n=1 Tax=Pithys albifrons albifrons TaxID=3385563 RepID=UPI003A5CDCDA